MQSLTLRDSKSFGDCLSLSDNPVDDAAAWMQNRLDGSCHPALNTDDPNIFYDKGKDQFSLLRDLTSPDLQVIYQEAEMRKKSFIETVNNYNKAARGSGHVEMDLHKEHTWDDVLSAQQNFLHDRDAQTGFRGSFRRHARGFADNSESFQSWLKLLPSGSQYLSILCGGLTLVFGAAHRMAEIRGNISDMFSGIPLRLSEVKQYLKLFEDSPELHQCSADLYVAMIDTLEAIVQQYQKSYARRMGSALFKQNKSGEALQAKIKLVNHHATRLSRQADISSMQRQHAMYEGEKDITKMMISSARNQDRGFNTLAFYHRDMSEMIRRQSKLSEFVAMTLNNVMYMLKAEPIMVQSGDESMRIREHQSDRPSPAIEFEEELHSTQLKRLLGELDIDQDKDVASTDTSTQLRLINTLSIASQDRAVALIMSPRLQAWLTSTSSAMMLVNGHMFSNEDEARQSPLSFFCAKLIDDVLNGSRRFDGIVDHSNIGIRWFCGLHTDMRRDMDAHPKGMMNSMVSQLINQALDRFSGVSMGDSSLLDRDLDLGNLNSIFDSLVMTLTGETILFCLIDGISYYEIEDRENECEEVLSMLTNLVRRCQQIDHGPVIKFMVTAPLRSHLVCRLFREEEILDMGETYPSNGGFSALQWDMGIGA
ncbi:MAG: hypothetical protein Q9205_004223, partial [Flavoplaca limonia]